MVIYDCIVTSLLYWPFNGRNCNRLLIDSHTVRCGPETEVGLDTFYDLVCWYYQLINFTFIFCFQFVIRIYSAIKGQNMKWTTKFRKLTGLCITKQVTKNRLTVVCMTHRKKTGTNAQTLGYKTVNVSCQVYVLPCMKGDLDLLR